MKTSYTGAQSAAALFEKYVGDTIHDFNRMFTSLDGLLDSAYFVETATGIFFFRYSATAGQQVLTGEDVAGRVFDLPRVPEYMPVVYVNRTLVAEDDGTYGYTVAVDGTSITFNNPLAAGDIIWISAFGVNDEGVYFFNNLEENKTNGVETIADLAVLNNPERALVVGSYIGARNYGGGVMTYEPTSTATVDNILVFDAPVVGGRFTRFPPGGAIPASWAGLIDSAVVDQGVLFQNYISYCIQKKYASLIDLDDINMGGRVIWFNYEGTASGYTQSTLKLYTDRPRAKCRLYNGHFFFGHMYKDVSQNGDGSELRWARNTNASVKYVVKDIQFRGTVTFWNIEGSPMIDNVDVMPETTNTSFYDVVPPEYGINHLGVTDTEGNPVTQVSYSTIHALCEFVDINHPMTNNISVQNGDQVTNSDGQFLDGIWIAGGVNYLFHGGRVNSCRDAIRTDSHPVWGSGNVEINIKDFHVEDFHRVGFRIGQSNGVSIDGGLGRPTVGWDGAEAAVIVEDTAAEATRFYYNYILVGYNVGVGIRIGAGVDITLKGELRNFDVGVQVAEVSALREMETLITDSVTDDFQVLDGENSWPLVSSVGPSSNSALAQNRSIKSFTDDFSGYFLSSAWREYQGTPGVTVLNGLNGRRITIDGDTASDDMDGGYKLATAPAYQASSGPIAFEGSLTLGLGATALRWWLGVVDAPGSDHFPCNVGVGDALESMNGTDWAGFVYSLDADTDVIHCVSRKGTGVGQITTTALTCSGEMVAPTYRVEISELGHARFLVNGITVAQHTSAITPATGMAAAFCTYGVLSPGVQRELYLKRIAIEQAQPWSSAFRDET